MKLHVTKIQATCRYSYAMYLWELLSGEVPYTELSQVCREVDLLQPSVSERGVLAIKLKWAFST